MKKITSAVLALTLLAALAGCATDGGGPAPARNDGKDREITTGSRVPQR